MKIVIIQCFLTIPPSWSKDPNAAKYLKMYLDKHISVEEYDSIDARYDYDGLRNLGTLTPEAQAFINAQQNQAQQLLQEYADKAKTSPDAVEDVD